MSAFKEYCKQKHESIHWTCSKKLHVISHPRKLSQLPLVVVCCIIQTRMGDYRSDPRGQMRFTLGWVAPMLLDAAQQKPKQQQPHKRKGSITSQIPNYKFNFLLDGVHQRSCMLHKKNGATAIAHVLLDNSGNMSSCHVGPRIYL